MAMVPESECNTPTLMVPAALAAILNPKAQVAMAQLSNFRFDINFIKPPPSYELLWC